MIRVLFVTIVFLPLCVGCEATSRFTDDSHSVSPEVRKAWEKDRSYYALIELIDVYLDPFNNKATRADVRRILGIPITDHPGLTDGPWVYPASRKVPYGSYAVFEFSKGGRVKEITWISE
jgi:hypothetical protein